MRCEYNLHPAPPCPEGRSSRSSNGTFIIIPMIIGCRRRGWGDVSGAAVYRVLEEGDAAGDLARPDHAETGCLEGVGGRGIVAPAREPPLLVIEPENGRWRGPVGAIVIWRYGEGRRGAWWEDGLPETDAACCEGRFLGGLARKGGLRRAHGAGEGCGEGRRREPIGDLVGDNDGQVVFAGQVAEKSAQFDEVGAASGHVRAMGGAATLKLGSVVGSDGVKDDEADVVTLQENRELVLKDMILRFQVRE